MDYDLTEKEQSTMDSRLIAARVFAILSSCTIMVIGTAFADVAAVLPTTEPAMTTEAVRSARQQKREGIRFYEQASGKAATRDNLAASLAGIARNTPAAEVEAVMALDVLAMSGENIGWAKDAIRKCYDAKAHEWTIKVNSVQAMLVSDRPAGIALGLDMIGDKKVPLAARLFGCSSLISVGCTDGYGVLREGLQSSDPQDRLRAVSLFKAFRPFNGTMLPKSGERIDLVALGEEFKREVDGLSELLTGMTENGEQRERK